MEWHVARLMHAADLIPKAKNRTCGFRVLKHDLAMQLRCCGHDHSKGHAFRCIPLCCLGSVCGADQVADNTSSIWTAGDYTDMVSNAGEVGNHLDLPIVEVVTWEYGQAAIKTGGNRVGVRHCGRDDRSRCKRCKRCSRNDDSDGSDMSNKGNRALRMGTLAHNLLEVGIEVRSMSWSENVMSREVDTRKASGQY